MTLNECNISLQSNNIFPIITMVHASWADETPMTKILDAQRHDYLTKVKTVKKDLKGFFNIWAKEKLQKISRAKNINQLLNYKI